MSVASARRVVHSRDEVARPGVPVSGPHSAGRLNHSEGSDAICTKAEIRIRPCIVHVTRHTFASLLLQQGESLTYVRDQMGHGSIQVTVDVYGHLVAGENRQAVDRLDDTAAPSQPALTKSVA